MNIDSKLIDVSKDGKYVYPVDSITGHRTFAPIEYFKTMVQKKYGGSVEKFVKEYVTRETKKYLAAGYTKEQVKEIASKSKNFKLPKISKPKKDERVPKKERKKRITSTSETVTNSNGEQEVIKTYPWSNDPDYFRSPPEPMNMAEATKTACWRPDIFLDEECYGCPYYDICQNDMKHVIKKK
jgi:hypothetical protein